MLVHVESTFKQLFATLFPGVVLSATMRGEFFCRIRWSRPQWTLTLACMAAPFTSDEQFAFFASPFCKHFIFGQVWSQTAPSSFPSLFLVFASVSSVIFLFASFLFFTFQGHGVQVQVQRGTAELNLDFASFLFFTFFS